MKNITKYASGILLLSTLITTIAFADTDHMGKGEDKKANSGTITAINGNTVTINLGNVIGIKVGDTISLFDRTLKDANRPIIGTVGTVGTGTFTIKNKKDTTITVNTSPSTVVKKDGKEATLADVVQGSMVKVKGAFDSTNNTITASSVKIFTKMRNGLHLGWFKHHGYPIGTPSPTPTP